MPSSAQHASPGAVFATDGPAGSGDRAQDATAEESAKQEESVLTNPFAEQSRERMEALAEELHRIADEFGPDAVVLQTKLLVKSLAAGALGPTEVKVVGPTTYDGRSYLLIAVATGILFDEAEGSPESRADYLWRRIAAPVLDGMGSFNMDPGGLQLELGFGVQDMAGLGLKRLDASEPSAPATVTMNFDARSLSQLLVGATGLAELRRLARARYGAHSLENWGSR